MICQSYKQITYTFPSIFPPHYKIDVSYQIIFLILVNPKKEGTPPCTFFLHVSLFLS